VVALPLAYYTMREWLQSFAYRTEVSPTLSCLIKRTVALFIEIVRPLRGRPDNVVNMVLQIFNPAGIVFAVLFDPRGVNYL